MPNPSGGPRRGAFLLIPPPIAPGCPATAPASSRRTIGGSREGVRRAISCQALHGRKALCVGRIAAVRHAAAVIRAPGAGLGGSHSQDHPEQRQEDNDNGSHGSLLGERNTMLTSLFQSDLCY